MSMDLAGGISGTVKRAGFHAGRARARHGRAVELVDDWVAALRLHQWAKNLLLFVPLFLGHIAGDTGAWKRTILGFLSFGLVVSATYLLNDLKDREADRSHRSKCLRPIAAGRIRPAQAGAAAFFLLAVGSASTWWLAPPFALVVAIYVGLTLAYSWRLKREPLIDVAVIGALFTLRLLMGAVLNGLTPSPWMLSFAAFLFFSLALAKRHAEVMRCGLGSHPQIAGRGYRQEDWPLTLAFGVAAAMASIVVMLLFIALEAEVSGAYRMPMYLFAAPAGVSLWLMRIWLFSHRMTLDDDPVLFAFGDWVSYLLGAIILAGFVLAL